MSQIGSEFSERCVYMKDVIKLHSGIGAICFYMFIDTLLHSNKKSSITAKIDHSCASFL